MYLNPVTKLPARYSLPWLIQYSKKFHQFGSTAIFSLLRAPIPEYLICYYHLQHFEVYPNYLLFHLWCEKFRVRVGHIVPLNRHFLNGFPLYLLLSILALILLILIQLEALKIILSLLHVYFWIHCHLLAIYFNIKMRC
jgi:hypothetical protein